MSAAIRAASRSLAFVFVVLLYASVSTTLAAQPRLATWRVTEQWRVDGTDAGEGFGQVRDVLSPSDGSLWILDAKDQLIRRYDANGKALSTVSRKGSGPGELQKANGMLMHRDGTIWVNDPTNSRFSVFGTDGKFVRQHSISITGYGYVWNSWVDRATGHVMDPVTRTQGDKRVPRWRRVDVAGKEAGDVAIPTCGTPEYRETSWQAETKANGSNMVASYPFMTGGGFAPNGDGAVWCAAPASRRVALVHVGKNDTIATTTIDLPAVPVTAAERESVIKAATKDAARYAANNFDAAKVPRTKPGIAALSVDSDGRLWIQHSRKAGDRTTTFDVHDRRGVHMGRVVLPLVALVYIPLDARGNNLWVPATDEDDVVSVVKMRIVK